MAASRTAAQTAIGTAEANVELARAGLLLSKTELERSYLRSPTDGRVLDVNAWPGERIGPEGVLELGNVSRLFAVAEVYETDIRHVRVGQHATVSSAALEAPVRGTVTFIRQKV